MNLYGKALAREKAIEKNIGNYVPKMLSGTNRKTGQAFSSLLSSCAYRTPTCSRWCYACKGPMSWDIAIRKNVGVHNWIQAHGIDAAAQRIAWEISSPIFRWMAQGDFCKDTVELANKVQKLCPNVKFAAFSRSIDMLMGLSPQISRVLSLDTDSAHLAPKVPAELKVAYLKTVPNEKIPEQVDIVFPLNHRKALRGHAKQCSFYTNKEVLCRHCLRCF